MDFDHGGGATFAITLPQMFEPNAKIEEARSEELDTNHIAGDAKRIPSVQERNSWNFRILYGAVSAYPENFSRDTLAYYLPILRGERPRNPGKADPLAVRDERLLMARLCRS
ncbi:hypothetical protein [Methylosinus sp. LW3]|uniref:hypothetical protein n=1 Tax=Methylosinus sp. LW3 TaxID=107635 RepID=UPI0004660819|nr:hypothetical protein [Methylosinus sp. LW3]